MSCLERFTGNKPLKFVILGPVKCGTCSLEKYFQDKYPNDGIFRAEIIWREDGLEQWEIILKKYPGAIPIIITRNPVDAIWSYYWYFKQRPIDMSLAEFLVMPINNPHHGELPNIAVGYDFEKWIKRWKPYNPIILSLEEMKQNPNFQNINKTSTKPLRKRKHWGWKDDKWPEITEEDRELIRKQL